MKFAFRQLLKNPGFTAVAVLTLALGIGANTAMFTLFHLFDRPLPQATPGRVVTLEFHEGKDEVSYFRASFLEYLQLREHTTVFSELSASHLRPVVMADEGEREVPQQVMAEFVSDSFFSVFESKLVLGRTFTPEETRTPGQDPLVILSYGFWQGRFGGDSRIVGRTVPINGLPFVVIGVTARDFVRYGADQKAVLWLPLTMRGGTPEGNPGPSWPAVGSAGCNGCNAGHEKPALWFECHRSGHVWWRGHAARRNGVDGVLDSCAACGQSRSDGGAEKRMIPPRNSECGMRDRRPLATDH